MKAFVLLALSSLASAQIGGQPRSKYDIFLYSEKQVSIFLKNYNKSILLFSFSRNNLSYSENSEFEIASVSAIDL